VRHSICADGSGSSCQRSSVFRVTLIRSRKEPQYSQPIDQRAQRAMIASDKAGCMARSWRSAPWALSVHRTAPTGIAARRRLPPTAGNKMSGTPPQEARSARTWVPPPPAVASRSMSSFVSEPRFTGPTTPRAVVPSSSATRSPHRSAPLRTPGGVAGLAGGLAAVPDLQSVGPLGSVRPIRRRRLTRMVGGPGDVNGDAGKPRRTARRRRPSRVSEPAVRDGSVRRVDRTPPRAARSRDGRR
jgi:hypothetical protein